MTGDLGVTAQLSKKEKRISKTSSALASYAVALGIILGTSALIMWPICVLEGWKSDHLLTIMLVTAFALLFIGCHHLDLADQQKRSDPGKSL